MHETAAQHTRKYSNFYANDFVLFAWCTVQPNFFVIFLLRTERNTPRRLILFLELNYRRRLARY